MVTATIDMVTATLQHVLTHRHLTCWFEIKTELVACMKHYWLVVLYVSWHAGAAKPKRARHVLEGPFQDGEQLVLLEGQGTTGDWSGNRIWPAAVALVQHLHVTRGSGLVGMRILELGCGVPLVGAALAALGAEVCSTDHPEMMPHVRAAVTSNGVHGLPASARERLRLRGLLWGAPANVSELCDFEGPVDLVVGADLVYHVPWKPLQEWKVLQHVLGSSVDRCENHLSSTCHPKTKKKPTSSEVRVLPTMEVALGNAQH